MYRLFLFFTLILFISPVYAQFEENPIIALSEGAIYALNPGDGSAEILVPAPQSYGEISEPASFFSAEWLSPDGQYLAYRTIYPVNPDESVDNYSNQTHRFYVLDLHNNAFSYSVSLGAVAAYEVVSVAWSLDARLLYVLMRTKGEDERWSLVIIENGNWTNQIHIELDDLPEDAIKRTIFATEDAVVLQARGWMSAIHAFIVFNTEGEEINRFELSADYATFKDMFISTPFTPLVVDGISYYSLIDNETSEILYQFDFATGERSDFPADYLGGMVSRANPANSLRIAAEPFESMYLTLSIRDADTQYLGSIGEIRYQAFGPDGDSMGSTFALSPDGQKLAYLDEGALMFWQDGEVASLDFRADVIAWGVPLYIPIYDPAYFEN